MTRTVTTSPTPFTDIALDLPDRRVGKVRVSYELPDDERLFVTTDRLSAFDRIVAAVPYKGQVLNELAAWWFANTADIVPNHVRGVPDPNVTIGVSASPGHTTFTRILSAARASARLLASPTTPHLAAE